MENGADLHLVLVFVFFFDSYFVEVIPAPLKW